MLENEFFKVQNANYSGHHQNDDLVELLQTLHSFIFNRLGSVEPNQH